MPNMLKPHARSVWNDDRNGGLRPQVSPEMHIFHSMEQPVDTAGQCPLCRTDLVPDSVDASPEGIIAAGHVCYNQSLREDEDEQDPGLRIPHPPSTAVQPEPEAPQQSNLGAAAGSSSSDNYTAAGPGFDADADNDDGSDDGSAGSDARRR